MLLATLQLTNGQTQKVVLRRHKHVEQEHKLLLWLQTSGVRIPKIYAWDATNRTLVLECIDGKNRFDQVSGPAVGRAVGEQLAAIHAVAVPHNEPDQLPSDPAELWENSSVRTEAEIRARLEPNWPIPESGPQVLIHGDFWPGNMLWQDDQLVGVIDWEDAKLGNRYQDLAISRFDSCFIFGRETMLTLTETYAQSYPLNKRELALWDLYAALRAAKGIPTWAEGFSELGRPDLTEEVIWASHRWFLDQAFSTRHL